MRGLWIWLLNFFFKSTKMSKKRNFCCYFSNVCQSGIFKAIWLIFVILKLYLYVDTKNNLKIRFDLVLCAKNWRIMNKVKILKMMKLKKKNLFKKYPDKKAQVDFVFAKIRNKILWTFENYILLNIYVYPCSKTAKTATIKSLTPLFLNTFG
mgnify:CR=1 FL=1